jgi:hypothetical protein
MDEQAHVGEIYNRNILEMKAKKPNWDIIKEDLIEMHVQDIHANVNEIDWEDSDDEDLATKPTMTVERKPTTSHIGSNMDVASVSSSQQHIRDIGSRGSIASMNSSLDSMHKGPTLKVPRQGSFKQASFRQGSFK